jgi:glycosyltransferase involved in cell wall biosynthesis
MRLSIVIPCYNEEKVIDETISVLLNVTKELKTKDIVDYEMIFVDDGSADNTFHVLEKHSNIHREIKIIKLSNNFGHQKAILAGYENSTGDLITTLDADLQDPPELIGKMIEKINNGFDIVYGARNKRVDSLFKRYSAKLFYWIMKRMRVEIIPEHAEYRMITRKVLTAFLKYNEKNIFIRAIFPKLGFLSTIIYYDRPKRFAGETKYPLSKMISFGIDGITSFSIIPLRLFTFIGMVISIFSLLAIFWSMFAKIFGVTVTGWTSIVVPIYFLGGIQMIFLGVLGEYVGKIYMEVKGRPRFIIEKKINL